jgi:hypothetical protein
MTAPLFTMRHAAVAVLAAVVVPELLLWVLATLSPPDHYGPDPLGPLPDKISHLQLDRWVP